MVDHHVKVDAEMESDLGPAGGAETDDGSEDEREINTQCTLLPNFHPFLHLASVQRELPDLVLFVVSSSGRFFEQFIFTENMFTSRDSRRLMIKVRFLPQLMKIYFIRNNLQW